jgi:catechol 2,3-dioxygenase-like lactoylglutathione lyase family enzyme
VGISEWRIQNNFRTERDSDMKFKYDYTRLLVSNFKECFLFYRDLMGFQVTYGTENGTYADFNTGTVSIALFDQQEMSATIGTTHMPAKSSAQDKVCLIFSVEDVDATCQQLKKQGIQLIAEPSDHLDWGIRSAYIRDPDGNLIEINQSLQGS